MLFVWKFLITGRLAKGQKVLQAHTARKDEQRQKSADSKYVSHVLYDSQLPL